MEIQLILNPLPTNNTNNNINDSIDHKINNFFQQPPLHQYVPELQQEIQQHQYQHQHYHMQQKQEIQQSVGDDNNQNEFNKYQWEDCITPSTHEYTDNSRKPRVIKKPSQQAVVAGGGSKVQQQKVRDWSSYSCKSIPISTNNNLKTFTLRKRLTKEKQIDYNVVTKSTKPNNKTTYNF